MCLRASLSLLSLRTGSKDNMLKPENFCLHQLAQERAPFSQLCMSPSLESTRHQRSAPNVLESHFPSGETRNTAME